MRHFSSSPCNALARSIFCTVVLLAVLSGVSQSQVRVGYDGNLSTDKGADLNQEMQLGSPAQRAALLGELGVESAYIPDAAAEPRQMPPRIDEAEGMDARLLFLPCSGPGSPQAQLYLLRLNPSQHWRAVDHLRLDCWWKAASYEWIQFQGKPRPSLLVHHVNFGHGSGMVEDHMLLYELCDRRMVKVLETEEESSETEMGSGKVTQHADTVLPFPDGSIEETRITSERHEATDALKNSSDEFRPMHIVRVERRRWRWNESSKSYIAGEFKVVSH